jgi:hypothetical protein
MNARRAPRTNASGVASRQKAISKKRLDDWLDDALADTFPASDPLASPPSDATPTDRDRAAQHQSPAGATTSKRSPR